MGAFGIMVFMIEFAEFLINAIQARGWSISEFARQAGIVQSSVSDVLNGKVMPSEKFVIKAAYALDMPYPRLLRLAGHVKQLTIPEEEQEEIWALYSAIPPEHRSAAKAMLRGLSQSGPQDDRRREGTIIPSVGAPNMRAQPPPLSSEQRFEIIDSLICALCPADSPNREEKMRWLADIFAVQAALSALNDEGQGDTDRPKQLSAVFDYLSQRQSDP